MIRTAMTGNQHSPNFDRWRELPSLKLWEVAAMIRGVDPHSMPDVTDARGEPVDLSHELRSLTSAVDIGELHPVSPGNALASSQTEVRKVDVIAWLRCYGHHGVANGLEIRETDRNANKKWTSQFIEEVRAYRQGHTAKETAERFGVSQTFIRRMLNAVR